MSKLPRHRVANIRAVVCDHFGITPAEIISPTRSTRISHPRQVAMHLARRMTWQSWQQIAAHFGREDHSTALHAHKAVIRRRAADPAFNARVREIVADVQRLGERQ